MLVNNSQTWSLAWCETGDEIGSYRNARWQDQKIAIFSHNVTLSPLERFVITGDVWLTQRKLQDSDRNLPYVKQSALEFIAAHWEDNEVDILSNLTGSFSLAVWDRQQQTLLLARDRVGARTLYYTTTGSIRWASSNLRSLNPHHSSELDLVALRDYLCCAFVPGERTLWRDVRELRPGTSLKLQLPHPKAEISVYWQLLENIDDCDRTLGWHGEQLRSLLEQVVPEHLPQDEPVGVFLSGGLDSSCITALAAKFHTNPIHTYSIHFGGKTPHELEFSSLVAAHCQTEHHILEITFQQMWDDLTETMGYLDDPIGDPLTVPNLLLGKLARQSVRVILNGEGGDPCFGGPKNQPMLINQLYGSQERLPAFLRSFQKCAADLPQLLKPDVWLTVQNAEYIFTEEFTSTKSYLNRLMALNIKFKGADQILTKVNNLTQAVALEGRSPLFDPRIVEMSMQIPPKYKLSGVQEKAVLKQAIADLLPDAIINRPKSGMMVPVQLGFKQYWHREAKKLLLSRNAAIAPYLNQSLIREWLEYKGDVWQRYGVKLWLLVSLEIWLQVNLKKDNQKKSFIQNFLRSK